MAALLVLRSRVRSDWEIPMFFLVPLALALASPRLIDVIAVKRAARYALAYSGMFLLASPIYAWLNFAERPDAAFFAPRSEAANAVTALWGTEPGKRIRAVSGDVELASALSFYSADHPTMISESNPCLATWVDVQEARKGDIVGICPDWNTKCSAAVQQLLPDARRVEITTKKTLFGREGQPHRWHVWLHAGNPSNEAYIDRDVEISASRKKTCRPRR